MNSFAVGKKRCALIIAVVAAGLVVTASAYQRHPPHKLRAVGLVEADTDRFGNMKVSLIPIAILADKRYYDAGIYESRPRPMAIENGIVYEVQKTGVVTGYVTVSNGERKPGGWLAAGIWQNLPPPRVAPPVVVTTTGPSVGIAPVKTNVDPDRPILHRGDQPPPAPPATTPPVSTPKPETPKPPASTSPPTAAPDRSGADDDPGRPRLKRGESVAPPAGTATATPDSSATDDDPNRPRLKRGAPAGQSAGVSAAAVPSQLRTPGTKFMVAISDAEPSESRSYEFIWKAGEKEETEIKARKLALSLLPPQARGSKPPELTNVVFRSFDLDLSNDAVVVLTAEVPGPPPPKNSTAKPVSLYITLIARLTFNGDLEKLTSSVTDSTRLDITPRYEFVDVADVDGDGVADLVFREYDFDQKGFILYSVGRHTVTTLFEGATRPLP